MKDKYNMKEAGAPLSKEFLDEQCSKFSAGDVVMIPGALLNKEHSVKAIVQGVYPYIVVFLRCDIGIQVSFTKQEALGIALLSHSTEPPDKNLFFNSYDLAKALQQYSEENSGREDFDR